MKLLYKFIFNKFFKFFSYGIALVAGRNFFGRVCVQHKGGGVKVKYLKVDRFRYINQYGIIFRILQNTFFSGFLGLIFYDNGLSSFILLSEGLLKGSRVFSGNNQFFLESFKLGSTKKFIYINLFDSINSFEHFPFSGFKFARAAGAYAKIISKDTNKSVLKLNSGWQIQLSNHALGTLGVVSNVGHFYKPLLKAGILRNKGIRPTVRGVIKNPCDHPHGGGEGRGSPPVAQVSPWGWLCKGTPTKNKKKDRIKRKLYKKI